MRRWLLNPKRLRITIMPATATFGALVLAGFAAPHIGVWAWVLAVLVVLCADLGSS